MSASPPTTPRWTGYVLNWLIVCVIVFVLPPLFTLLLSLVTGRQHDAMDGLWPWARYHGVPLLLWTIPFYLVATGVIHLLLRRVRQQWVHALAFSVAGFVSCMLFFAINLEGTSMSVQIWLAWVAAWACGIARWLVNPSSASS